MSSFFLKKKPKSFKKRKNEVAPKLKETLKKSKHQREEDEIDSDDIEGSDDEDGIDAVKGKAEEYFSDEGIEETPQDKRLRLAKEYLQEIEKEEARRAEDNEIHDHVSRRLQTEYLDSIGKLRRNIAASITGFSKENIKELKHKKQKLPICTIVISSDNKFLFSGAKTQYIVKWDAETLKAIDVADVHPHTNDAKNGIKRRSHIIAMCLTTDMKFLAIAEGGKNIQIWCPKEMKHLNTFIGHRDIVTSLAFRRDLHELFSGSRDRSVKLWSLDEMAYVESLFGHQAGITSIDALNRERAITSGGIDCSLRIWKITEESQLVYNGHSGSIEHVKFINDENFVSCGDDGSLCLWSALKKKPLHTETNIHGRQTNGDANWITAVAVVINTDLIATGSCDGFIRLWQTKNNCRGLSKILEIPMIGFINSLAFTSDGLKLIVGIGQEHRLGRWWKIQETRNKIVIIEFETNKQNEMEKS